MVSRKNLSTLILVILLITSLFAGCAKTSASSNNTTNSKGKVINIGITQIVEHPALDAARSGFVDALASKGYKDGENIKIDFQNAQGDIPTAQVIAKNFVSGKKDLILAIATPSAQAAYNATKDIPILITAVTDPVQSGLAKAWDRSGTNVTGTSDAAPLDKQFELIKELVPNARKVGILYNTSEANSQIQVDHAKQIAPNYGFQIVTSGVTSTNDIPETLDSLLPKIDVLYVPTDNLVVSSIAEVLSKCNAKKIPVIGSEKGQVDAGALATEGIDYYKLGFQTGLMAVDVISGKKPQDMPIDTLKNAQLIINSDAVQRLNITVPADLKTKATFVKDGAK